MNTKNQKKWEKLLGKFILVTTISSILTVSTILPFDYNGAAIEAKIEYENRSQISPKYKWNLKDLYKDKISWEKDLNLSKKLAQEFHKNSGKLSESKSIFIRIMKEFEALMEISTRVGMYAKLSFDVNMSNPEMQDLSSQADNLSALLGESTSWFVPEINGLSDEIIKSYTSSEELAQYKVMIEDLTRVREHVLSMEKEEILASFSPVLNIAEDTFKMLSKDIKYGSVKNEKDEELEINRANYISLLESSDKVLRKNAFMSFYNKQNEFKDSFATLLISNVKGNNINAKARKYESAQEASLYPNKIDVEVYNELLETVNKNLPLMHHYIKLKKQTLGLADMHMYDIYVTSNQETKQKISIDKAQEMVMNALSPMGKDYTDVLKDGFSKNWIDYYSTSDKNPGGYQTSIYGGHPYILLNYFGNYDDVFTLSHELGHGMQSYYTNKKQPLIYSDYPIFTAEVASTLNEILLIKYALKNSKDKAEKIYLLNKYLENFRNTMFRQTMFAEFEKILHEKDSNGESLNAKSINKIYFDLNKKYYGDDVVMDEEIGLEWTRIPHFYNSFYVYQYATSFAASNALALQILTEGSPAVERIKENFLSSGSSVGAIEVLKASGVDMFTSKAIEDSMKIFQECMKEYEDLINEEPKITFFGSLLQLKNPLENLNGKTFISLIDIKSMDKIKVEMNVKENTITVTSPYKKMEIPVVDLSISEVIAGHENNASISTTKAFTNNGVPMLPLRFVFENLGYAVVWRDNGIAIKDLVE